MELFQVGSPFTQNLMSRVLPESSKAPSSGTPASSSVSNVTGLIPGRPLIMSERRVTLPTFSLEPNSLELLKNFNDVSDMQAEKPMEMPNSMDSGKTYYSHMPT